MRISEDNGLHWTDCGEKVCFDTESTKEQMLPSGFSLDKKNDVLVRFFSGKKADKDCYGCNNQGTYRAFYSISRDQGVTWTDPVQIVDMRNGYDAVSWGPGFRYGERGGTPCDCVWMDDGSVVVPFDVHERLDGTKPWYFRIICARGHWKKDMSGFDWVFGSHIEVSRNKSLTGCGEPTVTRLGGNRLFMVTRCQGITLEALKEAVKRWGKAIEEQCPSDLRALQAVIDAGQDTYSTRYSAFSEDGGMTWSAPEPLVYDDGTTVWTPASYSAFYESSRTGKTYWIGDNVKCCGWDEMEKPEDFAADCVRYEVEIR